MAGGKRSGRRRARGTIVRKTRWGTQRVRTYRQWCDEVEAEFLDCLAASCSVELACEQAGVGHTSVYRQRRQRPDFADKWQVALEQGYARLEMTLVETANQSLTSLDFDATRPIPRMSAETALALLKVHRAAVTGRGKRSGYQSPPRQLSDVQDSILRKIAAIRGARAATDGEGE